MYRENFTRFTYIDRVPFNVKVKFSTLMIHSDAIVYFFIVT